MLLDKYKNLASAYISLDNINTENENYETIDGCMKDIYDFVKSAIETEIGQEIDGLALDINTGGWLID